MRRAPGASRESFVPTPGGVSTTGRAVGGKDPPRRPVGGRFSGSTGPSPGGRRRWRCDAARPLAGLFSGPIPAAAAHCRRRGPVSRQASARRRAAGQRGTCFPASGIRHPASGVRRPASGMRSIPYYVHARALACRCCVSSASGGGQAGGQRPHAFRRPACARSRTTCTQARQCLPGRARWRRLGRIRFAVDGRGAGLLSPRSRSCPPQRRGPHARLAGRTTAIGLAHAASADPGTTAQRGGRRCSCRPDGGGAGVSARAGARPGPARAARGRVGPAAAAIAHAAYRHGGRHDRAAHRRGGPPDQRQKLMKPVMIRALEKSMKNAPTRGATRKARGATP